jgi:hypothetical protein
MNSEKIYSITPDRKFISLKDGKVRLIGSNNELGKRYTKDGTCLLIKCVEFDFYQNGSKDRFFFEDDELVYYFISIDRGGWLNDLLMDAINLEFFTQDNFITTILEGFVLHEMGFTADGQ